MKGAIFDVDGTILDSMTMWHDITNKFFAARNIILPEKMAVSFKEMTLEESIPLIKNTFHLPDTIDDINNEFKKMLEYEYLNIVKPKPYVIEYLNKLHNKGVKLAIATSGYKNLCEGAFKRLGIWNLFDGIALSSEVGVNKSNPDIYLLASKKINIPPKSCMVYEDISAGIIGAKKAGMLTTAVFDVTNKHITDKLKSLSDFYINTWNELL